MPVGIIEDIGTTYKNSTASKSNRKVRLGDFYLLFYENPVLYEVVIMGNIQVQMFVPEGATYTGYSFWEGAIFRVGSDVYVVSNFQYKAQNNGVHVIAHKVKEVIIADYYLNDEAYSNPLFLMEDGSIKAYSSLEGGGELDDESRLVTPEVEGGFGVNKTY